MALSREKLSILFLYFWMILLILVSYSDNVSQGERSHVVLPNAIQDHQNSEPGERQDENQAQRMKTTSELKPEKIAKAAETERDQVLGQYHEREGLTDDVDEVPQDWDGRDPGEGDKYMTVVGEKDDLEIITVLPPISREDNFLDNIPPRGRGKSRAKSDAEMRRRERKRKERKNRPNRRKQKHRKMIRKQLLHTKEMLLHPHSPQMQKALKHFKTVMDKLGNVSAILQRFHPTKGMTKRTMSFIKRMRKLKKVSGFKGRGSRAKRRVRVQQNPHLSPHTLEYLKAIGFNLADLGYLGLKDRAADHPAGSGKDQGVALKGLMTDKSSKGNRGTEAEKSAKRASGLRRLKRSIIRLKRSLPKDLLRSKRSYPDLNLITSKRSAPGDSLLRSKRDVTKKSSSSKSGDLNSVKNTGGSESRSVRTAGHGGKATENIPVTGEKDGTIKEEEVETETKETTVAEEISKESVTNDLHNTVETGTPDGDVKVGENAKFGGASTSNVQTTSASPSEGHQATGVPKHSKRSGLVAGGDTAKTKVTDSPQEIETSSDDESNIQKNSRDKVPKVTDSAVRESKNVKKAPHPTNAGSRPTKDAGGSHDTRSLAETTKTPEQIVDCFDASNMNETECRMRNSNFVLNIAIIRTIMQDRSKDAIYGMLSLGLLVGTIVLAVLYTQMWKTRREGWLYSTPNEQHTSHIKIREVLKSKARYLPMFHKKWKHGKKYASLRQDDQSASSDDELFDQRSLALTNPNKD